MVRPISGQQRIQGGNEFHEDEGVTLRATRGANGTAHTRGAQGAQSRPAHGTVRDEIVQTPRTTQTPGQAAVAARHTEIRDTATALLRQADATPPGPMLAIPPRRTETFQGLVNQQHDRAFREGGAETVAALAGVAAAPLAHFKHNPAIEAVGIGGSELPHAYHVAHHPTVGGAIDLGLTSVGHGFIAATNGHSSAAGVGGAAQGAAGAAGISATIHTAARIYEDGDERQRFQQNASVYDARRAEMQQQARLASDHGVLDGHLAAAGRRPINWDMYRTNGDYASGVRRGLADGARNPSEIAHLSLYQPQPARTSIP